MYFRKCLFLLILTFFLFTINVDLNAYSFGQVIDRLQQIANSAKPLQALKINLVIRSFSDRANRSHDFTIIGTSNPNYFGITDNNTGMLVIDRPNGFGRILKNDKNEENEKTK